MPRFDRSASIVSSSAVLRASLSGLVTVSTAAQEGEALGELRPLGGAGHLLAEDALGTGRSQVALLSRQPGRRAA